MPASKVGLLTTRGGVRRGARLCISPWTALNVSFDMMAGTCIATHSEGEDPNRRVIITPLEGQKGEEEA